MTTPRLTIAVIVFCVILGTWASCRHEDQLAQARTMDAPEPHVERGPRIVPNTWLAGIQIEKERQDSMMAIWMLQSTVKVDGTIPLWGLLCVIIGGAFTALMTFLTMRNDVKSLGDKLVAHEGEDERRHKELREDIQSLR